MWIIGIIAVVLIGGGTALLQAPSFGKNPDKAAVEAFKLADNYDSEEGTFINSVPTKTNFTFKDMRETTKAYSKKKDSVPRIPEIEIPIDTQSWDLKDTTLWVSWLGHSSQYIGIEDKSFLIDPVFSKRCSPFQWAGSKRFHEVPHDTASLPKVDAVIISHDHYDHLDTKTIKWLSNLANKFVVPLGVGSHLKKWGVDTSKIVELNWWDSVSVNGISLHCTPARHFSGRRIKHQNETLWASWAIVGKHQKLFYSGDTGYFEEFKKIGNKLGPFDVAVIQTGAYDSIWADIHMFPSEVIQTFKDVQGKKLIPVHWGTFNLAIHNWKEPAVWLKELAIKENLPIVFPLLNEQVFARDCIQYKEKYWFE